MRDFPTRESLMAMPLKVLRGLDIDTPEHQALVQTVVNERMAALPPERKVYRNDVPDIQNPEEEMRWQQVIDERTKRLKNREFIQDETPTSPTESPAPIEVGPQGQPLAQPTGEGMPVSIGFGVASALVPAKHAGGRPRKNK
jgi:hypothetical protein